MRLLKIETGELYYVDNEHGLIQDEETEEWYRDFSVWKT
jgi:hypothetical protein